MRSFVQPHRVLQAEVMPQKFPEVMQQVLCLLFLGHEYVLTSPKNMAWTHHYHIFRDAPIMASQLFLSSGNSA